MLGEIDRFSKLQLRTNHFVRALIEIDNFDTDKPPSGEFDNQLSPLVQEVRKLMAVDLMREIGPA